MIFSPITELISKFIDMMFPYLKYRGNLAIPSRDKISKILIKCCVIFWFASWMLGMFIGYLGESGKIPEKGMLGIILLLILISLMLIILVFTTKPASREYWESWWRGESPWWKILTTMR